jgi:hypothetical protein
VAAALAAAGWDVGSGYQHFHSSFDLFSVATVLLLLLAVLAAVGLQRRRASETVE